MITLTFITTKIDTFHILPQGLQVPTSHRARSVSRNGHFFTSRCTVSILVTYLTHYVLFGMALLVPVALGLGVFRAVAGKTGYGAFSSLRSVDDLLVRFLCLKTIQSFNELCKCGFHGGNCLSRGDGKKIQGLTVPIGFSKFGLLESALGVY